MTIRNSLGFVAFIVAFFSVSSASANVIWSWTLSPGVIFTGTEQGTFTTDGTIINGALASGTYNFVDFGLTSSTDGLTLGSVSGGQYAVGGLNLASPFTMDWNGATITQFNHGGSNPTPDRWAFSDLVQPGYIIGFEAVGGSGFLFKPVLGGQGLPESISNSDITNTSVAEPASITLVGTMLSGGLIARRRRGRKSKQSHLEGARLVDEYLLVLHRPEGSPDFVPLEPQLSDEAAVRSARRRARGSQFEVWRRGVCITGLASLPPLRNAA